MTAVRRAMVPVRDDAADTAAQDAYAQVRAGRGFVPNVFGAMAHSPELLDAVSRVGSFFRTGSVLDPTLREAVVLAVAYEVRSSYEWSQHVPVAKRLGLDPVAVVTGGTVGGEQIIDDGVAFARSILSGGRPSAETEGRLSDRLGVKGLVELTVLTGYYAMLASVIEAWSVPLDPGVRPVPFPDEAS
jgi:4-carboxymuconolactone decarboxylase